MTNTRKEPMGSARSKPRPAEAESSVSYESLGLVALVMRVVHQSDRCALNTLLASRSVFRLREHGPLPFDQFIESLKEIAWVRRWVCDAMTLDQAGNLVRDRFSLLADPSCRENGKRTGGPDCRRYFRAFLESWDTYRLDHPDLSTLEEEIHAARLLQRFVSRHFRLACREAGRTSNPTRSRYTWRVDGRAIHLWMPKRLSGAKRRTWLETHVDDVDPYRPGERERIQEIVDAHFGVARVFSIDDVADDLWDRTSRPGLSGPDGQAGQVAFELPRYVAREKAKSIDQQRATVQALGAEALETMVLEIFRGIEEDSYSQAALALRFGISESTVTRFAAKNWEESERIPDLWGNTAHVLADHPPFVEAAKEARIWEKVEAALRKIQRSRSRRRRDV